jgi:nitrogen fixation/metabolism regulation signal transduction histidine kinase
LIFEPYFSTRKAGRGLGLHVAKDILAGYNSSLELVSGKLSLPGACFEVRFDQRRVIQ